MPALVRVRNIHKKYGTVDALADLGFEIRGGEVFGLFALLISAGTPLIFFKRLIAVSVMGFLLLFILVQIIVTLRKRGRTQIRPLWRTRLESS